MIPEAAVEAAAKAALGRYLNKATIQLILEAAAPHIVAEWEVRRENLANEAFQSLKDRLDASKRSR